MPTYQYACTACEHRFEAVQKFTDDSLTVCPECAGTLRKVYGSVGVVFKGSGWYRNDSRGGPVSPNADAAKPDAKGADKSSDKAGDKSAATSTTTDGSTAAKKSDAAATGGSGSSSGSASTTGSNTTGKSSTKSSAVPA